MKYKLYYKKYVNSCKHCNIKYSCHKPDYRGMCMSCWRDLVSSTNKMYSTCYYINNVIPFKKRSLK